MDEGTHSIICACCGAPSTLGYYKIQTYKMGTAIRAEVIEGYRCYRCHSSFSYEFVHSLEGQKVITAAIEIYDDLLDLSYLDRV
jgi:transposase-like protein